MKILVVGLDCAAPERLFGDDRLENVRRLMDVGTYGRLKGVIPPTPVPAWMCMATSQDPGMLGVYGPRDRLDRSYGELGPVDSGAFTEPAIWDQVGREGGKSVLIGVPPDSPPRRVDGISIGWSLTPDAARGDDTYPTGVAAEIERIVGHYTDEVETFRTEGKDRLGDGIYAGSREQFAVVRHYLQHAEWDYFQFVATGLDCMHRGVGTLHDPGHEPDSPYRDSYRYLDEQIGRCLELLIDDTVVAVVSCHGAPRLDGGFCVNEWLIREGLLTLNRYPEEITAFGRLDVDWRRTRAWSEGGAYARVFLNVKGREPEGVIEPGDYERFLDEIRARLEAIPGPDGRPMGNQIFKPEEIYRSVRNVAPDLLVAFGGGHWKAIGGVGHRLLHHRENDDGPDDGDPSQQGAFIIAAPQVYPQGMVEGVHLLDIAPTLLELGGHDRPPSMRGRSLPLTTAPNPPGRLGSSAEDEMAVRERLRGLGYIG